MTSVEYSTVRRLMRKCLLLIPLCGITLGVLIYYISITPQWINDGIAHSILDYVVISDLLRSMLYGAIGGATVAVCFVSFVLVILRNR